MCGQKATCKWEIGQIDHDIHKVMAHCRFLPVYVTSYY